MLVRDFLDLPANAAPDEFIVRPNSDAADVARKYTLTTAIEPKLNGLLRDVHGALGRNEDIGRFVFGSFGSGKSHFLRIAGMMLANDARLYHNTRDDRLRALRNEHPWLENTKILVVPVMMLAADAKVGSFTRSLATEFDRALVAEGKPALNVFGVKAAFEAFDAACARTPQTYASFEDATGYPRDLYAERRAVAMGERGTRTDPEYDREYKDVVAFARQISAFLVNGRDDAFDPTEAEARSQMSRHAKEWGYDAIAFAIDEFVLWAQGLLTDQYAAAVNALNALVESSEVKPVRFIALAAIQRSVNEVFPADRSDEPLRQQLARVKDRFPEIRLEDNNIFEIAEKRVLAPRPERKTEWVTESRKAAQRFAGGEQSVLVGDEPASALVQLYPFHPALLRVLSDVAQGLQRARSSLYMLYQLIADIRPDLKMGELVSLGALWDVLFAREHLAQLETYAPKSQPTHSANRLLRTHATYERLAPVIATVAKDSADDRRLLELVVKSGLLAQLSHTPFIDATRGLDAAITVENLFRLNRSDIAALNDNLGFRKVERLLGALSSAEPGVVSLQGTGPAAVLRIELDAIDLTELLEVLRPGPLFPTLLAQAKLALNLTNIAGQEGRLNVDWRHTTRNGRVRFENFDQFSTTGNTSTLTLEANDDFKLGILLESEGGRNPQESIENVRALLESTRDQRESWAAAWLPAPLPQEARNSLTMLAKIALFDERSEEFLTRFKSGEHSLVRQRMGSLKMMHQATLADALKKAYQLGRVITLRKDPGELLAPGNLDPSDLPKNFAAQLLDRRYQQHPKFLASPNQDQLNKLVAIDRRITADPANNTVEGDEREIVKKIGEPLDVFEPGAGVKAKSGMYLDRISQYVLSGDRKVSTLLERLARDYGIGRQVGQALLCIFIGRLDYRVMLDGVAQSIMKIGDLDQRAELAKGELVTLAQWNNARAAASMLFTLSDVPTARTVGNADALARQLEEPIATLLGALDRCCEKIKALRRLSLVPRDGVLERRYFPAQREVAALVDRSDLVAHIADLDIERYKALALSVGPDTAALTALESLSNRQAVIDGSPDLASELKELLERDVTPIAPEITRWIERAKRWIDERLRQPLSPPRPPQPPAPRKEEEATPTWRYPIASLSESTIETALAEMRLHLRKVGAGPVTLYIAARLDQTHDA